MCHFFMKADKPKFLSLQSHLPEPLLASMNNPQIGATGILRDMRPWLMKINANNPRVVTVELAKVTVSSDKATAAPIDIPTIGWLDVGTECFCVTLIQKEGEEKVVRFKYVELSKVVPTVAHLSLEV